MDIFYITLCIGYLSGTKLDNQGDGFMPVIVFASSKGGAGKTTACVILACELARQGASKNINVSLIDVDPNQHSAAWARLPGVPTNITLHSDVSEEGVLDVIEKAKTESPFVLVDLEGVSSNAVTFAVSQADLVIVPCQSSQNDAREAVKTIKMVKNSARMMRKNIPLRVLFTRVSAAIVTKTSKYLMKQFEEAGIDVCETSLIDREPFKSIFSFGGSVYTLDDGGSKKVSPSIQKARDNSHGYGEEVKKIIKEIRAKKAKTECQKVVGEGEYV